MVDLFFTRTFIFLRKTKNKKPALCVMLRHFHGLYSHRPLLSTNQRARIHIVIVKHISESENSRFPVFFLRKIAYPGE